MPLSEHLRELRNRLFVCMAVLLAAALAGLHFAPQIVELLLDIGRSYRYRLGDTFVQHTLRELVSVPVRFPFQCRICGEPIPRECRCSSSVQPAEALSGKRAAG